MAITKKLIHFNKKEDFLKEKDVNNNILDTSIVFIKDTQEIWTHDKFYAGLSNVTNDALIKRSEMGVANGVATLDENGLVSSSQLPSFTDDVLEYDSKSNFPIAGETGKIYVAKDSNLIYRWSGAKYIEISSSLALGETSSTAYAGDKGKDIADKLAKVRNTQLSHIKDTDTFSTTSEKVSLNYDCYVGDLYGATATSYSVDIPVSSETQAGIITAEDKKAIINLDSTYAKQTDINKSIENLSNAIATSEANSVIGLTEASSSTYANTYVLKQGKKEIGTINIPKDMVVSSGSLKTVTSADNPYTGAKIGDKYIDLVISNAANDHIYIPVSDLIDTYTAGDGLTLLDSTFSIKKDETSEGYLTVGADGIKVSGIDKALNEKVDKVDGKSLTSNDFTDILKAKLEGIAENANNYSLPAASTTELGGVIVDSTLSIVSTNPVLNRLVASAIDEIDNKLSWATID